MLPKVRLESKQTINPKKMESAVHVFSGAPKVPFLTKTPKFWDVFKKMSLSSLEGKQSKTFGRIAEAMTVFADLKAF